MVFRLGATTENVGSSGSNRRTFLKTLGFVGVSAALAPTMMMANPVKGLLTPSSNAAWLASCDDWLSCVTNFVWIISESNPELAKRIIDQLEASEIEEAPRYGGFHYRYAPRHAFTTKVDRSEVICGNGFLVDLFPYYGDCTCYFDMNAREMARVTNAKEMNFYGCVVKPAGARKPPEPEDHTDYRKLLRTYYTNHDPDDYTLAYTREMTSAKTGKSYTAYGVNYTRNDSSNTSSGDVLISKDV